MREGHGERRKVAIGEGQDRQVAGRLAQIDRRGDLVKLLWWDGDGLCLLAKRLERGHFI